MKIDRETKSVKVSRAEQVRSLLQQVKSKTKVAADTTIEKRPRKPVPQRITPNIAVDKINLFGSKPLGIFSNKDMRESTENKTWQALYERDLKLAVTHPPSNYFQQMILWTEQGKLWKFPIDNEQDLEEEKKVYFTEHIFLEDYLEPWCPPKGTYTAFYGIVEAKKEHIDWYKNYFEEKRKILEEVGAIPAAADKAQTQKTLE
ncbi:hypothetical protein NQ317_012407 [Molorchus minor]|uniref:Small ribosomal subunit protein mS31 n=1 Tax=Molorchus minor TaxID=1323400 RepID=A0ABQ9JJ40_9CUCU|nr:hypothetical protein NQ317_012407 [Molorchus minor]